LTTRHGSALNTAGADTTASAGVSPTAVYRHFDNSAELLSDAVVYCWQAFDESLELATDPGLDPISEFRCLGAAYVTFAEENPGQYRAMFSNAFVTTDSAMRTKVQTASIGVFAKLVDRIADMLQQNGDDRDPSFVATQVHTWIHGIVEVCTCDDNEIFPTAAELLDDLVLRLGLVADNSR